MEQKLEDHSEGRPLTRGWEDWKRAAAALAASLVSLGSVRLAMARLEAREWGRALLVQLALLAAAAFLAFFALGLLTAALVAVVHAWIGSVTGALFLVFGLYAAAAGALFYAASRSRVTRPVFEATLREIRKDVENFTGADR